MEMIDVLQSTIHVIIIAASISKLARRNIDFCELAIVFRIFSQPRTPGR